MERQLRDKETIINDMQRQLEQLEREARRARSSVTRQDDDNCHVPEKGTILFLLGD